MIYHIWNKTFTGYRFIDVWGVSEQTLLTIPGIELFLYNLSWHSISLMFKTSHQKSIVERLIALGAVEYGTVPKSS